MKLHPLRKSRKTGLAATMTGVVLSLAPCHEPRATADTTPHGSAQPSSMAASAITTPFLLSYPSHALGCGALTEADCQRAQASSKNDKWQTQQEGDDVAYARAWVAECKMRRTYVGLMRKLAANPSAVAKLEEAQRKWLALSVDNEKARFPHIDERGFYGSVLPMCLGVEEEGQSLGRDEVLKASGLCHEDPAGRAGVSEAARLADAAMNDAYQKVRIAFAKDAKFIAALTQAQGTWIAYRNAQVAFAASASGSPDGTCAMRELAGATKVRAEYLGGWLTPDEEGNVCAGSYAPP